MRNGLEASCWGASAAAEIAPVVAAAPAVTAVELADGIVGPVQQVEAFQFPVTAGAGFFAGQPV